MSGGYYNQQGYGGQPEPPRYLQQNYGHQNQGFAPAYQHLSEEYLRQPAASPYPTAPMHMPEPAPMHMPEPAPIVRMTEPPQQEAPRVIIVQQPAPRPDEDCCAFARCLCRCVDWLLTQICYVLLSLVLLGVLIGLGVWLINKYRHH